MKTIKFATVANNFAKTLKIKTFLTLLLVFFIGQIAFAQNWLLNGNAGTNPAINFLGTTDAVGLQLRTNNLPRLTITSAGNVGIGTTTPTYPFHVYTTTNSRPANFQNLFNSAGQTYGIYVSNTNAGAGNATGGHFLAAGSTGTNRAVYASASGTATNYGVNANAVSSAGQTAIGLYATVSGLGTNLAARFDGNVFANGNVGILQNNPAFPLHFSAATGNKICLYQSGTNQYGIGIAANLMQLYVPSSTDAFVFGTGSSTGFTERMRIEGDGTLRLRNSNGNTYAFDVDAGGDLTFRGDGNALAMTIGDVTGNVGIGIASPNAKLHVNGDLRLQSPNNNTFLLNVNDNGDLQFRGDGGNLAMIIGDQTGAVGINTSTVPAGYQLAVNGRVICEELRVQLSSQWGDYVFSDDYNLMPLEELEKSIQVNKHLPGIPSAAQIEKDGIAVGEMQTKMMVKIEELTLYMIQLKKENEALKLEIEKIKG
ncbi:MAG: hypothetical protein ACKVT2_04920 [Saprospiraceae bacterium]